MNRIAIVGAIAVLAAVPACTVCGKVTASRDYVDEKVASATSALRSEIETEIESVAPAGYEIVSNRAMSAVQLELDVKTNRTSLTVGIDRQGEIGANSVVFGAISSATGTSSFAHGYRARAYGENSHAEGVSTLAAGVNSHAEGNSSTARGGSSHAEGAGTLTEGYYSHAEGMASEAHGTASHAEGSFTKASGEGSHSEGSNTVATNKYAHAEGFRTGAYGIGSHAEGYNTFARGKYSHASGMSAYANDDYSYVWGGYDDPRGAQASKGSGSFCVYPLLGISGFYIDGKNLRSIIYEESAVTKVNDRVGDVSLTADDVGALPVNKGGSWTLGVLESETNIAEAATLKIVGGGSSGGSLIIDSYIGAYPGKLEVHGHDGRAFRVEETGPYMGSCEINGSKISLKSAGRGYSSFASMIEMPSVHLGSVVYSDILLNEVSVWDKINSLTNIENDISFIKDNAAIAEKDSSGSRTAFMFGAWPSSWTNKVSGFGALSQGFASYASNQYSHAEGYQTVAEGLASHAEGNRTKATGTYSHAEGQSTVASGNSSHADGYGAVASNEFSYAWSGTIAGGGSHGDGTFSIYPNGGISGFYIDGKSLADIISVDSGTFLPSSWTNGMSVSAGLNATASRASVAIGWNACASNTSAVALGSGSKALHENSLSFGSSAKSTGYNSVAIGTSSEANQFSVAIGYEASATGHQAVAIGRGAKAYHTASIAIGPTAETTGDATLRVAYNPSEIMLGVFVPKSLRAYLDEITPVIDWGIASNIVEGAEFLRSSDYAVNGSSTVQVFRTTRDVRRPLFSSSPYTATYTIEGCNPTTDERYGTYRLNFGNGTTVSHQTGSKVLFYGSTIGINGSSIAINDGNDVYVANPTNVRFYGTVSDKTGSTNLLQLIRYSAAAATDDLLPAWAKAANKPTYTASEVGAYTKAQTDSALAAKADKSAISAADPTFSSAVLAVGLNIDTNSVAVLNEIASAFGGFPIEGTATTVGGLLAALAAAIAWLKRNKADKTDVDTLAAKVGDANEKLEEVA